MSMLYEPLFNTVVVEIDDKEAAWGGSKDESAGLLGQSYNKGTLIAIAAELFPFGDTSRVLKDGLEQIGDRLQSMVGQKILWNKGHEGDNIFEQDGKKYAIMFWWDILGVALPDDVTYAQSTVGREKLETRPATVHPSAPVETPNHQPHNDSGDFNALSPQPLHVSLTELEQLPPQIAGKVIEVEVSPVHNGAEATCSITAEMDIAKTRQALKRAGVPGWETIEIVGGGHENHHLTGIR
jgi:co-chaperonin GroES (HSP10)